MYLATLVFWLIALLTACGALLAACARNILHAAFGLCLSLLGVAGLYVFLHADYVAAAQMIIYVGGILVLIVFAVMFSSNVVEDSREGGGHLTSILAGGAVAIAVFALLLKLIDRLQAPLAAVNTHGDTGFRYTAAAGYGQGSQTLLGHALLGEYLLPFEFVSILLLAALIGAVAIVRKEVA